MAMKMRSPSYPAVDLKAAVDLAVKIYPGAKHPLGASVIAEEWGYASISSASPYLAALKKYGLLEELPPGNGGSRLLKLTPLAIDIVVDPSGQTTQRANALKKAALNPAIHAEMWEKWGGDSVPESEIRRYLEVERNFNPKYVGKVAEVYKNTIAFSKVSTNDIEANHEDAALLHRDTEVRTNRKRKKMPGTKEDIYTLSDGDVVIQWPEEILPSDLEDLDDWLDIMKRKIKRSVVAETPDKSSAITPEDDE